MKTIFAAAVSFAALIAAPALAQDTAPDGTPAFGIKPYVGVLGGYDSYDKRSEFGLNSRGSKMDGALVEGVAGVNLPLGPGFVGVEGNAAKGFSDINWEYGVSGRVGFRAGDSGLIYGSAGYEWVHGKSDHGFGDHNDWVYGVGLEVGPKSIGLPGATGNAGPRLRLEMQTYNFSSIRPMAGVVFHL